MRCIRYISLVLFSLLSLVGWGQEVAVDTVAQADTTVRMSKLQQMKTRAQELIKEKMNEPWDTIRDNGYWWRAMKHGKVDLDGGSIDYPAFIDFCWKVYKWGDKAFNSYDTAYVVSTGKNWKFMFKSNNWSDNYTGEPMRVVNFDMRS